MTTILKDNSQLIITKRKDGYFAKRVSECKTLWKYRYRLSEWGSLAEASQWIAALENETI